MPAETRVAIIGGKCDWCPDVFDEGDYVAHLPDNTIMCPACIVGAWLVEAAA